MDILHPLKLDWTLTGLQTFGGETIKDEELMININDVGDLKLNKIDEEEEEEENKVVEINKNLRITIDDLFKKTKNDNNDDQVCGEELDGELEEEIDEEEEDDEEDYESINPTTTPIGKSCIDELILDLTNNSFDNNTNTNLIDSFLTSSTSLRDQKYDESSSSSTTTVTISSPIQQLKIPQIKSNIDDLLNLRPRAIKPPTIQQQPTQINEIIKNSPKKLTQLKISIPSTTKVTYTPPPTSSSTTNVKSRPQITQVVKNELMNKPSAIQPTPPPPSSSSSINNNNNNKKTVIYKVESKDVKTTSNEIIKHQNEDKQRISINPLLTDHNTSLLTKLKPKCEPQSPIINQTPISIKQKSSETITPATSSLNKIYTINDSLLNDVVKCVNKFDNYESYLKIAQKYSPIINKNLNKHNLPFCARSLTEYFSWPFAKRRANEWMRALNIKQRANSMIIKSVSRVECFKKFKKSLISILFKKKSSNKISLWSTKKVLTWLRSHGYTPLDNMVSKKNQLKIVSKSKSTNNDYISSLTPFDKLFNNDIETIKTNNEVNYNNNNNKNEFIDIIGDNTVLDDNLQEIKMNKKIKQKAENLEYNSNYDYLLEMSSGGKYVKEQLNMVIFLLLSLFIFLFCVSISRSISKQIQLIYQQILAVN